MLVVADSSPLITLIGIGHVEALPNIFQEVVIPPEVSAELVQPNRQRSVRDFMAGRPAWLIERTPSFIEPLPGLHPGELAAIGLARELNADLLLIDEVRGRRTAADLHIPYAGTVGVLEIAADRGMLDLPEAFDRVKQTDFWISHRLLDERPIHHLNRSRE